jgi:CRISPR-associated protein Csm3
MKQLAHHAIQGTIVLRSGTRIGGSDDVLQIGGTDLTWIKGKMRSGLEKARGKISGRDPCGCARPDCPVCRVFGPHKKAQHELGPTRIKVYDAPLISDDFRIELKTESVIRRDTGAAEHPRTLERVAPGARFRLRIDLMEYDLDKEFRYKQADGTEVTGGKALIAVVDHAIDLLESSGIGAGTGKGYGEIAIEDIKLEKLERRQRIFETASHP